MIVIIPIGGKGERFLNQGFLEPKPMIKIMNKLMIDYVLESISDDNEIYIIYNKKFDEIKNSIGFNEYIKLNYPYVNLISIDYQTKGAAETVKYGIDKMIENNKDLLNKSCLLMDCDTFYDKKVINEIIKNGNNKNCVVYFEQDNTDKNSIYSYIEIDNNDKLLKIKEKDRISNNANTGIYMFNDILKLNNYIDLVIKNDIKIRGEYYTSIVINEMIKNGEDFYGKRIKQSNVTFIGTPEQLYKYLESVYIFLFDLDGTLVRTDHIYFKVWKKLIKEYFELELTINDYQENIMGNHDKNVLMKMIQGVNEDLIKEISNKKDELFLEYIDEIEIIENSYEFIKEIYFTQCHKIGVVTNCNRKVAEKIIEKMGINKMVDILIIGGECDNPKPYPDPYKKALYELNIINKYITNKKCIIFEDSNSGILSAKGISPRCIVKVINTVNKCDDIECDYEIDSFSKINFIDIININNMNDHEEIRKFLEKRYNKNIIISCDKMKGGYIADVLSIQIENEDFIFKRQIEGNNNLSKMAIELDLYEREYYFYKKIRNSDLLKINVPKCYDVIIDKKMCGIILEKLQEPDFKLNLDLNKEDKSVSLKIINRMAELHNNFAIDNLLDKFQELKKHNDKLFKPKWGDFVRNNWFNFRNNWKNILSENGLKMGDIIIEKFEKIQDYLSEGNLTLCHGDIKSANIFYKINENYEPFFIDWQYISYGKGVQDLVFFMIESFSKEKVIEYTNEFKEEYFKNIKCNREEFEKDFKMSICYYPFFVGVWFGTLKEEELIDVEFPIKYIPKLFEFLENNVSIDFLINL